jgi:signal transduction histidine kinase
MKILKKAAEYFISDQHRSDAYLLYRYRLLLNASIFTSIFSLLYLVVSLIIEFPPGVYYMVFNVAGFLLLPFLMRTKTSIIMMGNLYVLIGTLAVVVLIYYSGGINSPIFPWLIAPPVLALLIVSRQYALVWTGVVLACLTVFILLTGSDHVFPVIYNQEWKLTFTLLCSSGIILIVVLISQIFESNTIAAVREVESQKKEIEDNNQILTAQREELLVTSEQLKELNEKKDYLMEILAHDLKSPLANIQALIGLIKLESFPEESVERKVMEMILDSSKKSQALIQKILSSENLENIVYNLKPEVVDVSKMLSHTVEELRNTARQKNIQLHLQMEEDKACTALADKIYLVQVFENLINNAIKFSPQNKNVYVSIRAFGKTIRVQVKDEGPGIRGEEMNLLFKKFKKLSNKPTGGESSTGLGLSIVKHYTELMKGKVWCESVPGQGADFIVELPVQ